jgi:NAD(P) transhydrogenase
MPVSYVLKSSLCEGASPLRPLRSFSNVRRYPWQRSQAIRRGWPCPVREFSASSWTPSGTYIAVQCGASRSPEAPRLRPRQYLPSTHRSNLRSNSTAAVPSIEETPYSKLTVGIPRETYQNERRVAATPQNVALLLKKGFSRVLVERDAGLLAKFPDSAYDAAEA